MCPFLIGVLTVYKHKIQAEINNFKWGVARFVGQTISWHIDELSHHWYT